MQAIAISFPICIMSLLVIVKCWKSFHAIVKKPKVALKTSMGWVILGIFSAVSCIFAHSLLSIIPLSAKFLSIEKVVSFFDNLSVYSRISLEIFEFFSVFCLVKALVASDKNNRIGLSHRDINFIIISTFILGQIFALVLKDLN